MVSGMSTAVPLPALCWHAANVCSTELVMGPLLLFDKTLLHYLNPEDIEELSMSFSIVSTPTLVREIIADLRQNKPVDYIPKDMVRSLARKMESAHAAHPANFRKLAVINLSCSRVPMEGQVPIDGDRPNVSTMDGGFLYDRTPEQRVWGRWANGDFDTTDEETAVAWRNGIERINLKAVGQEWKEWVNERLGNVKTIPEIITAVDALLKLQYRATQEQLFDILLNFLRVPRGLHLLPIQTFLDHDCRLEAVAPYAASVLRLYLTFVAGVAKGCIGPRKTNYVDLQYLFYAPFCMLFASEDHFHEKLWPATSGVNTFVKVKELRADLAHRIQLRKDGVEMFQHGYPIRLENSAITRAMDHAFGFGWRERFGRNREDEAMKPGTRIEDLPKVHRDRIREAFGRFNDMPNDAADLLD